MPSSIGHYALAHYHGKIAAKNIAGKETPLKAVPFFWTMLFGKSYRYAGEPLLNIIVFIFRLGEAVTESVMTIISQDTAAQLDQRSSEMA